MNARNRTIGAALIATMAGHAMAQQTGDVIITEIYYATNQGSGLNERFQEFVELYNTTQGPIDVSGWFIVDDGTTSPFPDGTVIPAGGALVVCGNDGDPTNDVPGNVITPEIFAAAWEPSPWLPSGSIPVIVLDNFETLANGPSSTNEILQLFTADGELQDEVNYDDVDLWPLDNPQGSSIQLRPQFLNAIDNDEGCSWVRADQTPEGYTTNRVIVDSNFQVVPDLVDGAVIMFEEQDGSFGTNWGSPGYVETVAAPQDCNGNGIDDIIDICTGFSLDCNNNGIPDECEPDCDGNGIPDECDIIDDPANRDCNGNGLLDTCEIADNPNLDLDGDGVLDVCQAAGDVIITEIMYNPPTDEFESEWVEIMNVSDAPVDISGWTVGDLEDGQSEPIGAGLILAPGEIAILINDYSVLNQDPLDQYFGVDPESEFRASWNIPASTKVIPVIGFGARGNTAVPGDEILAISDTNGVPSDIVDYISDQDLGTDWPVDDGTSSIYLIGSALDAQSNNNANSWRLSVDGIAGAFSSNGSGVLNNSVRASASPGIVDLNDPQPVAREVIITELHATTNPERRPFGTGPNGEPDQEVFLPNEFVEILNVSDEVVDISGWYLRDEDGLTDVVPAGTTLQPNEAAILFQMDSVDSGNFFAFSSISEAQQAFYDAWGCGYQVIPLRGWGSVNLDRLPGSNALNNLSNSPNTGNEILTLRDSAGGLVDIVNYDDDGIVWPFDGTGDPAFEAFSIYLLPGSYDGESNDDGFNWAASFVPFDQARNNTVTDFFNAPGLTAASPGAVEGVVTPDLNDCRDLPCNLADLAEPFGSLNFFDVSLFLSAFNGQDPAVDFDNNGEFNFFDVSAFLTAFSGGCP